MNASSSLQSTNASPPGMLRKGGGFILSVVLLGLTLLALRYYEVDLPIYSLLEGHNRVDPAELHLSGEFVESNLGTALNADGSYTVRMIAQQYLFVPQCIVVPAGVPVQFRVTSADASHLLSFSGTPYSIQAAPGYVSTAELTFDREGQFPMPCRRFCGPGHYAMRAQLKVVNRDQLANLRPYERITCALR